MCPAGFHRVQQFSSIIFGIILFTAVSCVNDKAEVDRLFEKKTGVDIAEDVESYLSQGGKMKGRLTAPVMYRYQDTIARVEFPKTVHVDFFDDSTKVESQLDANYAQYYESNNRVFMKDSVRVFNIKGDTLFCQELWWDQTKQLFHTDKPVRIHRPDMIMIGVGLSAPQDFKTFEMYRITNSIIRVKDEQFPG